MKYKRKERMNWFRCVDDGYCSFEQANMIQEYVENKINELYPIDQTNGKSLLKINDKENIRKARILSDDDNSPESSIPQNPYINEINKVISPSSLSDGSSMWKYTKKSHCFLFLSCFSS